MKNHDLFLDELYEMPISKLVKIPVKKIREIKRKTEILDRCMESLLQQDLDRILKENEAFKTSKYDVDKNLLDGDEYDAD